MTDLKETHNDMIDINSKWKILRIQTHTNFMQLNLIQLTNMLAILAR